MAQRQTALGSFLNALGRAVDPRTDDRLLADFYARRDEQAFAALVRRHQRTVWSVCARVLNEPADAEDAFQATFILLARKGQSLARRGSVGGWLYRVAERVARKSRVKAVNRRRYEGRAGRPEAAPPAAACGGVVEVVTTELGRLPENHRLAVALCDLDGLSRADAASRLGWNEGTLSARLHRGRKELAERLRARGVTAPAAGLVAVLSAAGASAAVPAGAAVAAARLARAVVENGLWSRAVPASVAALVSQSSWEGSMRLTTAVTAAVTLAAGVLGVGWLGLPGAPEPRAAAAPVPEGAAQAKPEVSPSALQLLRDRKVHRELKCTAEQRVAIADHFEDMAEAAQANRAGGVAMNLPLRAAGPANPNGIREQMEAEMKRHLEAEAKQIRAVAEKVLKTAQLQRLAEIDLQVRGVDAFADPKVADSLKLTDDQKQVVAGAIEAARTPADPPPQPPVAAGGGVLVVNGFSLLPDPKARKAAYEKVEAALTPAQKTAWKKMTGDAVGFDPHTVMVMAARGGISVAGFGAVAVPAMPAVPVQGVPAVPPAKKDN